MSIAVGVRIPVKGAAMHTLPYRTLMHYKRWATNGLNAVIAGNIPTSKLTLGEEMKEAIREVVREEMNSALKQAIKNELDKLTM